MDTITDSTHERTAIGRQPEMDNNEFSHTKHDILENGSLCPEMMKLPQTNKKDIDCAMDHKIPDSSQRIQISCSHKHGDNDLGIISDLLGKILDEVILLSSDDSAHLVFPINENKAECQTDSAESCCRTIEDSSISRIATTSESPICSTAHAFTPSKQGMTDSPTHYLFSGDCNSTVSSPTSVAITTESLICEAGNRSSSPNQCRKDTRGSSSVDCDRSVTKPALVTTTTSEHQVNAMQNENDLTEECDIDITDAKISLSHGLVSSLDDLTAYESLDFCDDKCITNCTGSTLLCNGATDLISPADDNSTVQTRCLQKTRSKRKSNPSKCSDFTSKTLFLSQRFKKSQNRNFILKNREIIKEWPGTRSSTTSSPDVAHIDIRSRKESCCNVTDSDFNDSKVLQNSSGQHLGQMSNSRVINSAKLETSGLSHRPKAQGTEFKDKTLLIAPQQIRSHSKGDTIAVPHPTLNFKCTSLQKSQVKPSETKIIDDNGIPISMIQSEADSGDCSQSQDDAHMAIGSKSKQSESIGSLYGSGQNNSSDQSVNNLRLPNTSDGASDEATVSLSDSSINISANLMSKTVSSDVATSEVLLNGSECNEQETSSTSDMTSYGFTSKTSLGCSLDTTCDSLTADSVPEVLGLNEPSMGTGLSDESTSNTTISGSTANATVGPLATSGILWSTSNVDCPQTEGSRQNMTLHNSAVNVTVASVNTISEALTSNVDCPQTEGSRQNMTLHNSAVNVTVDSVNTISKVSTSNVNCSSSDIALLIEGSALKMPLNSVLNSTIHPHAGDLTSDVIDSKRLSTDSGSDVTTKGSTVKKSPETSSNAAADCLILNLMSVASVLNASRSTSGNIQRDSDIDGNKATSSNSSQTSDLNLKSDQPIRSQVSVLNSGPPIKTVDSSPSNILKKKDHNDESNRRYSLRKKTSPLYTDYAIYTHSRSFYNRRRSNELGVQEKSRKRRVSKGKKAVSKENTNSVSNLITVDPHTQMTKGSGSETASADENPDFDFKPPVNAVTSTTGCFDNKLNGSIMQPTTKDVSSSSGLLNTLSISASPLENVVASSTGHHDTKLNGSIIQPPSTKGALSAGLFTNRLRVSGLSSRPAEIVPSAIVPIKKLNVSTIPFICAKESKCNLDKDITARIPNGRGLDQSGEAMQSSKSRKRTHHEDAGSKTRNSSPNFNKRRNIRVVRLSGRVRKPSQKMHKERKNTPAYQPNGEHAEGRLPQALVSIKRLVVPTDQITHISPKKIKIAPVKTVSIASIPTLKAIKPQSTPKILNNAMKLPRSKSLHTGIQTTQPQDGVKNNASSELKPFTNHVLTRHTNRQTRSLQDSAKLPNDGSDSTPGGDSQRRTTGQPENLSCDLNFRYVPKLHDILSTVEPGAATCCFCHLPANHVLGIGDLFGPYRPLAEEVLARQGSYNKHLDTPGLWEDVEPAYAADGSPSVTIDRDLGNCFITSRVQKNDLEVEKNTVGDLSRAIKKSSHHLRSLTTIDHILQDSNCRTWRSKQKFLRDSMNKCTVRIPGPKMECSTLPDKMPSDPSLPDIDSIVFIEPKLNLSHSNNDVTMSSAVTSRSSPRRSRNGNSQTRSPNRDRNGGFTDSTTMSISHRFDTGPLWTHGYCAVWADGVYAIRGQLHGLWDAMRDSTKHICVLCERPGATIVTYEDSFDARLYGSQLKAYHYPCALNQKLMLNWENLTAYRPN